MNYARSAKEVAKDLVGKVIDVRGKQAEIVETEAYEGGEQTQRRHCMLLAPGQIGVMPYRGFDFMNVGTQRAGEPSCVLIRAVRIGEDLFDGPGKVGKVLEARLVEYQMLGKDILVTGTTKESDYTKPAERSDNSQGRYRLRE
jgi:3-methyladenine DNA glycosylase Mpg